MIWHGVGFNMSWRQGLVSAMLGTYVGFMAAPVYGTPL